MFKLDLSPSFKAAVRFEVQSAAGTREVHEFIADFKRLTADELDALGTQAQTDTMSDRAVAAQLLVGWAGVTDRHGNALDFTPDNAAAVLNVAGVAPAVVTAFRAAQPKAALGN